MYGELGNQNMLYKLARIHDKKHHPISLYAVNYNRLMITPACMFITPAENFYSIAEEVVANTIGLWMGLLVLLTTFIAKLRLIQGSWHAARQTLQKFSSMVLQSHSR